MTSFKPEETQSSREAAGPKPKSSPPEAVAGRVLGLYRDLGDMEYHGEAVSQLEHALQTAQIARDEGGSDEEIIAALLHDIGHIWPGADRVMTSVGVVQHDRLGAETLRDLGFSEAVAAIVAGHVEAKRYLVGSDSAYAAQLSEASMESLRLQGGPMSPEEAESFFRTPWSEEAVRLRLRDDRGKTPGLETAGLEEYRELLVNHLAGNAGPTRAGRLARPGRIRPSEGQRGGGN